MPLAPATFDVVGESLIHGKPSRLLLAIAQFQPGGRAFSKAKALRGILESVIIKRITVHLRHFEPFEPYAPTMVSDIDYLDTFNWIWDEEELVKENEARDLAIAYWELQFDYGEAAVEDGA